ncbi:hypothetical protein NC651_000719 [Populus alba x Populus x berolinensis]|nr:hypothetical protein NC651_000719 [Populus alba x Populus x berolinensis]
MKDSLPIPSSSSSCLFFSKLMLSAWIGFPSLRPHSFSPPLLYLKVYQFLTPSSRENLHVVDQSFLFLLTPMVTNADVTNGGGWVAGRSCWWSVCHNVGFLLFCSSSLLSFSQ